MKGNDRDGEVYGLKGGHDEPDKINTGKEFDGK